MTADLKPVRSALGDRLFDLHYHCKFSSPQLQDGSYGGHNYFLRPKDDGTLQYELATRNGTTSSARGKRLYPRSDVTLLFKPV